MFVLVWKALTEFSSASRLSLSTFKTIQYRVTKEQLQPKKVVNG